MASSVGIASNEVQGLAVIAQGTCKVDLIFTDRYLPGPLNEIDLENLALQRRPHLPINLSSGSRTQQLEQGCTPTGLPDIREHGKLPPHKIGATYAAG